MARRAGKDHVTGRGKLLIFTFLAKDTWEDVENAIKLVYVSKPRDFKVIIEWCFLRAFSFLPSSLLIKHPTEWHFDNRPEIIFGRTRDYEASILRNNDNPWWNSIVRLSYALRRSVDNLREVTFGIWKLSPRLWKRQPRNNCPSKDYSFHQGLFRLYSTILNKTKIPTTTKRCRNLPPKYR